MDIGQAVTTLISTIVGGGILIATNWISVQVERKKTLREWYEQTYITEGVDPLITYFLCLNVQLRSRYLGNHSELPNIDLIPAAPLVRIQTLLGDGVLTEIVLLIHEYLGDSRIKPVPSKITKRIAKIDVILLELRKELLGAIPTRVSSKVYQIDVPQIIGTLITLRDELNSIVVDSITKETDQHQLSE